VKAVNKLKEVASSLDVAKICQFLKNNIVPGLKITKPQVFLNLSRKSILAN